MATFEPFKDLFITIRMFIMIVCILCTNFKISSLNILLIKTDFHQGGSNIVDLFSP